MEHQLSDLICQLFRGQNVKQANEAIFEFIRKKESWEITLRLLDSSELYVKFFCANIIYNKIRRDSSQLNEVEKKQLFSFLLNILKDSSGDTSYDYQVYLKRIILSLIVVSFRLRDGLRVYLQSALESVLASIANNNLPSATMSLRLLMPVPEELEASDVSSEHRTELMELLSNFVEPLFSVFDGLSSSADSTLSYHILATAKAWCSLGMNLSILTSSHQPTFHLIQKCIFSPDTNIVIECWSLIQELVVVSEYPRSTQRSQLIANLLQLVTQRCTSLDLAGDAHLSTALCNLLVSVASVELSTLAAEDPSSSSSASGAFFSLLLSTVQLRPRRLLMLTFDLWVELQDSPLEALHEGVRSEVLLSLLSVCVAQCRHNTQVSEDEEECEDWSALRDPRLGLSEVLGVCHFGLGTKRLFHALYQLLPPLPLDVSHHSSAAQLEAVLFTVAHLDSLKATLEAARTVSPSPDGVDEAALVVSFLHELTFRCLSLSETQYTGCVDQHMAAVLRETVCRFLGALTFLLTKSTSLYLGREVRQVPLPQSLSPNSGAVLCMRESLLLPTLQFLLTSIASPVSGVSSAAAKSLHQLCTHGLKWITQKEQLPLLKSMCSQYGQYVQSGAVHFLDSLLLLTESLVRSVVSIKGMHSGIDGSSVDPQHALFALLTDPVVNSLLSECSTGNVVTVKVHTLLSLISQIVRFCDAPADTANSAGTPTTHILLPVLQRMWPVLEQIGGSCQSYESNSLLSPTSRGNSSSSSSSSSTSISTKLMSVIFEIFGRVFSSLGSLALPQTDRVAHLVLSVLSTRGSPSCPAALKCASVLVEFFVTAATTTGAAAGDTAQFSSFLSALLSGVVEVFYSAFRSHLTTYTAAASGVRACLSAFNNDLDCLQEFFSFIYGFLVFSPSTLLDTQPSVIPPVVELLLLSLEGCSEREPLRVVLQVLQCGFCPPSQHSSPAIQRGLIDCFLQFGESTVSLLLRLISQGSLVLSLASNVADALLSVIAGCASDVQLSRCQGWFHFVLVADQQCFSRLESVENRILTLNLLFYFGRQNSRRFKVLVQDLMKICSCELTVDALMAYSDVLAGQ